MAKYARIDNGSVAEIFETEEDITQLFHPDLIWVDITNVDPSPEYGWIYKAKKFSRPQIDYKLINDNRKQELRLSAESNISVLQYAADLEMATPEESTLLTSWKKYLVLLSRVNTGTESEVDWPEQPVSAFN
ncbi:tail fiber assembly protein [Pantoea sp. UBA5037]|uniref:tail fiber assembly protein n=1 Tax=Pantoea sp. UBA5037 TaxID=1947036 RepID=UPI00257FBAD1|nr:tail fiber assembly protein [Pantoea sp. UBA5037]